MKFNDVLNRRFGDSMAIKIPRAQGAAQNNKKKKGKVRIT
jgi:hypothetical protein